MASAWILDKSTQVIRTADLDEALRFVTNESTATWINLTPEEFEPLADRLGFHPQAIEDAMKAAKGTREAAQRTKLDRFPHHVFLYLFRAELKDDGTLDLNDVPMFVNRNSVIVVDKSNPLGDDELIERWRANPELLRFGTTAMVYAGLDIVIDSHLDAVDQLADVVDGLEDDLFNDNDSTAQESREVQLRSFAARKSLVRLRRVTAPMRELISGIMRREQDDERPLIDPDLLPYYQDLYDHTLRVNDTIDGLRDLITTIYETRLAMYDHQLNTVTRQLAAWAGIIAVPTAITGFYGQNIPYPGIGHPVGFWTSTILWVSISIALYFSFKRRGWL